MSVKLNPDKAYIFRITHVDNVPWILENGLHCPNSDQRDPNYVSIGSRELISKRDTRQVELPPGGTLSDYVPFYFTPFSIMMYNIKTGYGVRRRSNRELVILVSSLHKLDRKQVEFVFTNQHAYPRFAEYYSDLDDLDKIDWELLRSRDFRHDPDDPGKKERYQAEALIYRHLPLEDLFGIGCHDPQVKERLENELAHKELDLNVRVTTKWYF